MQKYQHIWKYACGYFQQKPTGRFVVGMSVSVGIALVLFVAMISSRAQSARMHVLTTCSTYDQNYKTVAGDTPGGIANRYGATGASLASYNNTAAHQVVCSPTAGAKGSGLPFAEVQRVSAPASVSAPMATPTPAVVRARVATPVPTSVATPTPVVVSAPAATPTPVAVSAPVATPTPAAVSAPATDGSVTAIIDQVFGPYAPAAIQVATCESGLNPGATNPYSSAAGLFQIMPGTWSGTSQAGSSPYNAWANTVAAHEIFVRDGYSWSEWTCK